MHTVATLTKDLRNLGLAPGQVVMVHASLRKLGPSDLGARGVIEALLHSIGKHGTMLMVLGAVPDVPFDALHTPVDVKEMGVLAEVFRTFPGVKLNDHASDRFAAVGPHASHLIDDPPLHDYLGPDSPLDRLVECDGFVLRLGADMDTVTLTHLAEYKAKLPHKRRVRRRYERADIGEQWIESLDDNQGIVDWPCGDYFSQILIDFLASGAARVGQVGSCTAEFFKAAPFLAFATRWMEANLYA